MPLIIGHRGAAAVAPENTPASFQRAVTDGAHGIEFDVRLTSDGVPVCLHDATLERTARMKYRIADLTSQEAVVTRVGAWFNESHAEQARVEYVRETIPTLESVLLWAKENNTLLYIELKTENNNAYTLAAQTARLVIRYDLIAGVVIESFDHAAVRAAKQINSSFRCAALFDRTFRRFMPTSKRIIEAARACEADEIALHHTLATPKTIAAAHEARLPVVVWTVDDVAWLARAEQHHIKALITNNPALFTQSQL